MVVIRCTQKLLARLGTAVADPPPSTTLLGDWYAKPFPVAQRRLVILASERSRMAVLMPGRDLATLPSRFPDALAVQLARLDVPQEAIDREVAACRQVVLATTASRSLLGTLNDHAYMAQVRLRRDPNADLEDEALSLSHTPLAPLGYAYPADVARSLFGLEPRRSGGPF